jgi:hypothetical protein
MENVIVMLFGTLGICFLFKGMLDTLKEGWYL